MSEKDSNVWEMDENVENELKDKMSEEEVIGMFTSGGEGEDKMPLVESWMPEGEEWGGKTVFDETQPEMITLAENLPKAFPVIKPMQPLISDFIDKYEMRLTSIEGQARIQQMEVFKSMFGGNSGESGDSQSLFEIALNANDNDD